MDQEEVGTMTVENLAKIINGQETISVSGQIQINNLKIENVDLSHQQGTTEIYIDNDKTTIEIDMANEAVANCQSLMRPDPMDELQCQKCGKRFADINTLKSHEVTHNDNQHDVECKFLCTVCGQKFDKANALSAHLVVHRNVKVHHCDICGLVFPDDQTLKEHAQIHNRQKVHTCQKYVFFLTVYHTFLYLYKKKFFFFVGVIRNSLRVTDYFVI